MLLLRLLVVVTLFFLVGCSRGAITPEQSVVWIRLGSWSGHGSGQTETFVTETGALRVRWETQSTGPHQAGTFKLTLLSSVSGRPLAIAADQRGIGSGESFVPETTRPMYLLIESAELQWSFTVEEAVVGSISKPHTNRSQRLSDTSS
jgi:hypothetical protein